MRKTIKVIDWINFNKDFYNGDAEIILVGKESFDNKDVILRTTISLETFELIFGDYELVKFQTRQRLNSDGYTIGFIIWPPKEVKK